MQQIQQQQTRVIDGGIFLHEKVITFGHMIQDLCDKCFYALHDVACRQTGIPAEQFHNPTVIHRKYNQYCDVFRNGLNRIKHWDETIKRQNEVTALRLYPALGNFLKYVVLLYHKELHRGLEESQRIQVLIPSLSEFLQTVYENLAASEALQNVKYFKLTSLEKRILVQDEGIRGALMKFARNAQSETVSQPTAQATVQTPARRRRPPSKPKDTLPAPAKPLVKYDRTRHTKPRRVFSEAFAKATMTGSTPSKSQTKPEEKKLQVDMPTPARPPTMHVSERARRNRPVIEIDLHTNPPSRSTAADDERHTHSAMTS